MFFAEGAMRPASSIRFKTSSGIGSVLYFLTLFLFLITSYNSIASLLSFAPQDDYSDGKEDYEDK
jgi:hypothetical protein